MEIKSKFMFLFSQNQNSTDIKLQNYSNELKQTKK